MTAVNLTANFFGNARGLIIADGGGITWSFNKNTNTLSATGSGTSSGTVTSVGLTSTAGDIAITGTSPIVGSGTFEVELKTQASVTAATYSYATITVNSKGVITNVSTGTSPASSANPTASVGLSAVNGIAATYMRSDGAPALNVGITPVWTGAHVFTPSAGVGATINAFTGNLAATFIGTGAVDTFALDCVALGRFTSLLVNNAGTLKAQFVWDNISNVATISTESASAGLRLGSGSGTLGLFFDSSGVKYEIQPNPTAVNATATLTIAQLLTQIITSTTAAAVTGTLPTGTLTDAGIVVGAAGAASVNGAFSWSVIATGANTFTVAAGTGHTLVGSGVVASGASGRFLTRKTATNTFVTYRLS